MQMLQAEYPDAPAEYADTLAKYADAQSFIS